jgi:hypothetical protein
MLRNLYLNTESRIYNINDVIFREGDESEFVYVIKKGILSINIYIAVNKYQSVVFPKYYILIIFLFLYHQFLKNIK